MEFTIIQDGVTPLAATEMMGLVRTLDVFFQEGVGEAPIRFDHLVESLRDEDIDWSDLHRPPTALEIMAACCSLERKGIIQTEFIGGLLHFVESPCA